MQHYSVDKYRARTSIGYLVKRANSLLIEGIEPALAKHGFTFTQWVIMMHLRDGLAVNARDICVLLRHDSGAVTRIVDQLEARGLVRRERSVDDRREVKLRLTDAGHEMTASLMPVVIGLLNGSLGEFSRAEVTELTRLLNKFIVGMGGTVDGKPGEVA